MNNFEGVQTPKSLEEAHALIKEAMKDVRQELLIIDKSGASHLVYVFDMHYHDGKLHVDYKAVRDSDEVHALVHEAIEAQIKHTMKEEKEKPWLRQFWNRCCLTIRTLFRRTRI
ncbi:head vertex assembly chaperone [Aeromonas phage Asfd_1]|nr:head vertex assembly chaperone [Aeromonas phage Asfd_1]